MKYFYKAIIFREFVPSQNNLRFGKVNPNLSYNWANPLGDITNANRNSPQISINKVGEYTVNISISGTACTTFVPGNFCLGVPMSAGTTNQVPLPNLAVGDIITAGEFEFTITQVTNATQPFAGKATINIINGPGHLKAGLKTEFAGISINECYQVTAVPAQDLTTYFRSEYDPSWGNIFDASTQTPKPAEAGEELAALIAANTKILDEMETFDQATATCGQKDRLLQQIAEIQAINTQINTSDLYTAQQKTDITTPENALITTLNDAVACITCTPGGRVAGVNCGVFIKKAFVDGMTDLNTDYETKEPANLTCKETARFNSGTTNPTKGDYEPYINSFISGNLAHTLIEGNYRFTHFGQTVYLEYAIPNSSVNDNQGYADIVNQSTGEIFEIKTVDGKAQGAAEAKKYVDQANIYCPNFIPWHLGVNYSGFEYIWPLDYSKKIVAGLNGFGVITYRIVDNLNPQLVPFPVPVTLPVEVLEKLKQLAKRLKLHPLDQEYVLEETRKVLITLSEATIIAFISVAIIGEVAAIAEAVGTGGLAIAPAAFQAILCGAIVTVGFEILNP